MYTESLTTERIITRRLVPEDHKNWKPFFQDPAACRFIPDRGIKDPGERAIHWVNRQIERYAQHSYGLHALLDRKTNRFMGQCGLLTQEIDGAEEVEIGYHLLPEFRGRGLATEAAKAFRDYAFDQMLTDTLVSIIDKDNLSSQKVANRNGMKAGKPVSWQNMDVIIYRIDSRSWAASRKPAWMELAK
jgi:RimJ/RimL family protein N-acetyltransferase